MTTCAFAIVFLSKASWVRARKKIKITKVGSVGSVFKVCKDFVVVVKEARPLITRVRLRILYLD